MRFFISAAIFLLLLFVGNSFAQGDSRGIQKDIILRVDNQWYIGSTPVEEDIIVNRLKSNPLSADDYGTAMIFYYPSLFFGGVGGFALGFGLVSCLDSDEGIYLTIGGAASIGLAVLLGHISNKYLDSSIELYNMYIGDEPAFIVKLLPTEQGGLALALAF